jgi:hypothetical protein
MDRRRKIQKEKGSRGDHIVILDQLESEVQRVLSELRRSRRESVILKNKMAELKKSLKKDEDAGELVRLKEENHELRMKMDRIDQRAREMLKRLDVIKEG